MSDERRLKEIESTHKDCADTCDSKALLAEVERLRGELEVERDTLIIRDAQIERRRQDREDDKRIISGLREKLDDAPHAEYCAYPESLITSLATQPRGPVEPCDCWKAALAAPAAQGNQP